MAFYALLLQKNYDIEEFEYQHLVMEKDGDNVYNCQTFLLAEEMVDKEMELIRKVMGEIRKETAFKPNNISWDDAVIIGARPSKDSGEWGIEI